MESKITRIFWKKWISRLPTCNGLDSSPSGHEGTVRGQDSGVAQRSAGVPEMEVVPRQETGGEVGLSHESLHGPPPQVPRRQVMTRLLQDADGLGQVIGLQQLRIRQDVRFPAAPKLSGTD